MTRNRLLVTALLVIGLTAPACQKLPAEARELPYVADDELTVVAGEFSDALPADFGHLVTATLHPDRPRIAYLWFEGLEGTITVVRLDLDGRKVVKDALVIPRR